MLVVRSKTDKHLQVPDLVLDGSPLEVSSVVKYLGHYIQDDLRDDRDMYRQCRKLYGQGNMLARKFHIYVLSRG